MGNPASTSPRIATPYWSISDAHRQHVDVCELIHPRVQHLVGPFAMQLHAQNDPSCSTRSRNADAVMNPAKMGLNRRLWSQLLHPLLKKHGQSEEGVFKGIVHREERIPEVGPHLQRLGCSKRKRMNNWQPSPLSSCADDDVKCHFTDPKAKRKNYFLPSEKETKKLPDKK